MTASYRLYIPIYAVTLLLSAFLLFLIQPLFGKMLLPLLGGAPSVWNTAMLFFQSLLLAGYAYAHGTARWLNIRVQALVHIALLVLFVGVLPIAIPDGWAPPATGNPSFWQLGLMAVVVGGPFFVLSGSAPMLQHWFAHTEHKDSHNPYFLYAASNLGSVTALLAYPVLIEPVFGLTEQTTQWAWGYGALIVLVVLSAWLAWSHHEAKPSVKEATGTDDETITWRRRGHWLLLAFVPSSLMLGITTYITTDLASAPLLWIVPLTLYISTFIIVFARKPIIGIERTHYIQGLLLIFMVSFLGAATALPKIFTLVIHLLLFFFSALMCHHELAKIRPHAGHLTQFYLIMSFGGALGGVFNALIAPNLFILPFEYALVLALAAFMRNSTEPDSTFRSWWLQLNQAWQDGKGWLTKSGIVQIVLIVAACMAAHHYSDFLAVRLSVIGGLLILMTMTLERRWIFALCVATVLFIRPPGFSWGATSSFDAMPHISRNFFGVVRVGDYHDSGLRLLLHGTTIHGSQALAAEHKHLKLSYYSENSGISDAFGILDDRPVPQKIAVLGLGIGVAACYQKDGRHFDFFEIDPQIVEVAEDRSLFTYLSDCGSPYNIIVGDARLRLADKDDHSYDIIVADAFSSDSIPVHLVTLEAFQLYHSKLKENGLIVVNISNRYLDLLPIMSEAAEQIGLNAYHKSAEGGEIEGLRYNPAHFVILTEDETLTESLLEQDWKTVPRYPDFRLWTDQYSNILSVMKTLNPPLAEAAEDHDKNGQQDTPN